MIYNEHNTSRKLNWLGLVAFALLYLPNLGLPELAPAEAMTGLAARHLQSSPETIIDLTADLPIRLFPVYAYLIKLISLIIRHLNEWAVRLPSVLAVLAMALTAFGFARHHSGRNAGLVSAAVCATSVIILKLGRVGDGQLTVAAMIAGAWFIWYQQGRQGKKWMSAWLLSLCLILAAAMTGGFRAFLIFYTPLFFLRRPFRIWKRFAAASHLTSLAIILGLYLIWFYMLSPGGLTPSLRAAEPLLQITERSYMLRFLSFPLVTAVYLLPWTFLAWPGFCAAFRPLERDPVLASFLRTLVISLFVGAWLMPKATPEDIVVVLPPLAVLCGLHYDIVIRRYKPKLDHLINLLGTVAGGGAVALLLFAVLHETRAVVIVGWGTASRLVFVGLAAAALALTKQVHKYAEHMPVWLRLVLAVTATNLVWQAAVTPKAELTDYRRENAYLLSRQVPASTTLFKTTERVLIVERFYIARPIKLIQSVDSLPAADSSVYVLGGARPPVLETRLWQEVSPLVELTKGLVPAVLWRPENAWILAIHFAPADDPAGRTNMVRTYLGIPRPAARPLTSTGTVSTPMFGAVNIGGLP